MDVSKLLYIKGQIVNTLSLLAVLVSRAYVIIYHRLGGAKRNSLSHTFWRLKIQDQGGFLVREVKE